MMTNDTDTVVDNTTTTINKENMNDIDMVDALLNKRSNTDEVDIYALISLKTISKLNDPRISKCTENINLDGVNETTKKILFFYTLNDDKWLRDFVVKENNPNRERKRLKLKNNRKFFISLKLLCEMYMRSSITDDQFLTALSKVYKECSIGNSTTATTNSRNANIKRSLDDKKYQKDHSHKKIKSSHINDISSMEKCNQ
jgi:hypothetical protein